MSRIVNRHPGTCRRCGQEVAAEEGFAVKEHPHAAWEVDHDGECPPHPHNMEGAPTWTVGGGEGYGTQPYQAGDTLREEWWTSANGPGPEAVPGGRLVSESDGNRRVSGIVTVVTAHQRYYADEGMSFGVGAEQGHYYWARVRAATEDEAGTVLAAEARTVELQELGQRVRRLLAWGSRTVDDAELPPSGSPELDGLRSLPQVPLRRHDDQQLHGDDLYVDEPGGWLWTVVHNGMDGDDWTANNIPGHIAARHPLTDERRQLVAHLGATFASLGEWTRAGILDAAARILFRAGVRLHDVADTRVAVSITTVEDARAYLGRSQQQWAEAGWEWPRGRRWPAREAARLAEAGIRHERAEHLRAAGFNTVEEILTAQPPRLPGTAGRYILSNCQIGPTVQITDDPAEAQQHLDRDPQTWAYWDHVPDVTAVHVARHDTRWGWQLWSNGDLSIGYWCEPRDGRERPRSLSEVAERMVSLVVSAGNPEAHDRGTWQPLLSAVEHRQETITEDSANGLNSGETASLVRHDVTLQNGTVRTLWDVVTGWWYHGEDADAGEDHWITADQAAARRRYQEHRPKRR